MLESSQIDRIMAQVTASGAHEAAVAELRRDWPGIHFTYCSEDDVLGPPPVRTCGPFNLYLVDGQGHCLAFTDSLERATGLVIAEVEE